MNTLVAFCNSESRRFIKKKKERGPIFTNSMINTTKTLQSL